MCEFKVGEKVNYHPIIGGEHTGTVHEITNIELMPNNFGCDVAWIEGHRGCVDFDALSHVD